MLNMLRTNRDLRWLFIAQIVSFMGDWFSFVAISGMIKDATGSEFLVSLAYVSFSLPAFFASPIAGPVVDRFDRRRMLMIVSGAQALCACGLLTAVGSRVWPLFVFQGLVSALSAFVKPAIDAAVPNLVRNDDEFRKANALFGSTWGVMLALGAAAGGAFSELVGRRASFVADAASFVLALGLIALVRRPMQERRHAERAPMRPLQDMKVAAAYARRDPVVLAMLASKASFAVGAGIVSQLPVLATEVFHRGDAGTGALLAVRGIGTGLGPIIASRFTRGRVSRVLQVCGSAGLLFSAFYLLGAWAPTIYLAAGAIAIAHLGGGAQWTLSTYGLQRRTTDEIRGRVMAGDFAIVTLVMGISGLLAGALSEAVGVQWALTAFAAVAGAASLVYRAVTKPIVARVAAEEDAAEALLVGRA
jgi:MFS family permease